MKDSMVFIIRFILFALFHSIGASESFKKIIAGDKSHEPRWYRLAYCTASLFMFMYTMAAYRNSSVLYFIPGVWSLIFYLAQLTVAIMLFYSLFQTGIPEFLGIRQLGREVIKQHLVKTGWYRRVRHPLYFLSLLFMALAPVMTVQWLLLTIFSLIYFILGAKIEEERLLLQFGDEYRQYMSETPFLIPSFKNRAMNIESAQGS